MSGHSHWASIKHKKGAVDAKRGKLFSKLTRLIMNAAQAGGSPESNIQLRYAIDQAKAASMPKDKIERAIKKGTGELAGEALEALLYEGYGPGAVAILVEALSDNRNRTAAELRKRFEMHGGKLGGINEVAWQFERKGLFVVDRSAIAEDDLLELVLEAGADNLEVVSDTYEVTCPVADFEAVKTALAQRGIPTTVSQISRIAQSKIPVDAAVGRRLLRLLEDLEDHDDVQAVHSNFVMDDALMAQLGAEV